MLSHGVHSNSKEETMKVLLLYPNIRHESLVPPSIALLSRILKNNGIVVDIFDSTDYDINLGMVDADKIKRENLLVIPYKSIERSSKGDVFDGFRKKIQSFNPDLIAMTATESTFLLGTTLLRAVRDNVRIPTVLGGVFATFAPALAMRYPEIDMCVIGEGEHTLPALCRAIQRGEDYTSVPGLWIKSKDDQIKKNPFAPPADINQNPTDLDISLFDDHRLYRPMGGKVYRMLSVETHRGCPYTCGFCNSPGQNELFGAKHFFRKKTPEKVREEILHYINMYGIEYVFFWADTFFAYSPAEFDAFIEMYKEIKLPFWCQTRSETVMIKPDRVNQLKDIGLHRISFGLEHGNEKFRREVVGRNMSNQLLIDAFAVVADAGLPFSVNNIIGFPGETRDLVFDTIEINRHTKAQSMSCSIFMPYQGTALHRLSVKKGYIPDDTICPSNNDEAIMNMSTLSKKEITGLRRTFAMYVRFPKSRWPEIRLAEDQTEEGDRKLEELRREYVETFIPDLPELYEKEHPPAVS